MATIATRRDQPYPVGSYWRALTRQSAMPTALLTGGAGFVGSHTCVELIKAGWTTVLIDDLSNSSDKVPGRIQQITGVHPVLVTADVHDRAVLNDIFDRHRIDAVFHFAGSKAVAESVERPLDYYSNNVCGAIALFDAMQAHNIRRIVFSSSATVYGSTSRMPVREDAATDPSNPYGRTKLMIEHILHDLARGDPRWRIMCLRYFNPVGAHESGLIGEHPRNTPNNLMPYVAQVALGRLPRLRVFGGDYPTPDGTGVRDYIHVTDLALGHLAAVACLMRDVPTAPTVVNIGTGKGHSVLEVVSAFMRASGRTIPYDIVGRRPGDVAASYAETTLAKARLDWSAERDLDRMCADAWRWQARNPDGYRD